MSLVTKTFIGVKCDCCGILYEQPNSGYSYWDEESDTLENAYDDDWELDDQTNKHYCPDCYHHDPQGNLVFHKQQL